MKLLSIDVGIKNLAYCLFEKDVMQTGTTMQTDTMMQTGTTMQTDTMMQTGTTMQTGTDNIVLWGVINLCGSEPLCGLCKKKAKFVTNHEYFCPTHALKSVYHLPTKTISSKKIKNMKLAELHQIIIDYKIPLPPLTTKKEDILNTVKEFIDKQMLLPISQASANAMDLVQIGIAMRKAFDKEFVNHLSTIDQIIIENQISPIANRMKSLQGMIAQYFIMHDKTQIKFVSAANKLKGYIQSADGADKQSAAGPAGADIQSAAGADKSSYADRKKAGIRITTELLTHNSDWLTFFKTHKKKDDLADAFLQGKWYLKSYCI